MVSLKEIKELIENNPLSLATVDGEGKPNVIGVAYAKIVSDDEIIITDNYMNKTKKNLQTNKDVALAVWDKEWKGYKLKGKATYYDSGKWLDFVKNIKENKEEPCKGAILIKISEIIKLA